MSNCGIDDDDDGPPPLEDLSDEIQTALNLKATLNGKETVSRKEEQLLKESSVQSLDEISPQCNSQTAKKSEKEVKKFGGMNKGFLFGSPAKKLPDKKKDIKAKSEDQIPTIKSQPQNSSLKFDEVQESQKSTPAWINDSLLG